MFDELCRTFVADKDGIESVKLMCEAFGSINNEVDFKFKLSGSYDIGPRRQPLLWTCAFPETFGCYSEF